MPLLPLLQLLPLVPLFPLRQLLLRVHCSGYAAAPYARPALLQPSPRVRCSGYAASPAQTALCFFICLSICTSICHSPASAFVMHQPTMQLTLHAKINRQYYIQSSHFSVSTYY